MQPPAEGSPVAVGQVWPLRLWLCGMPLCQRLVLMVWLVPTSIVSKNHDILHLMIFLYVWLCMTGGRNTQPLTSMDEIHMMCRIQQDAQALCSRARLASNKPVGWCWKCLQYHPHAGITFTISYSAAWSNPLCGFSSGSLTCHMLSVTKDEDRAVVDRKSISNLQMFCKNSLAAQVLTFFQQALLAPSTQQNKANLIAYG